MGDEPAALTAPPGDESSEPAEGRVSVVAAVLLEIGGAMVVIGSLLAWRKVLLPTGPAVDKGIDFGPTGTATLVGGIAALLLGVLVGTTRKRAFGALLGLLGVVAAGVAAAEALYSVVTLKSHAIDSLAANLVDNNGVAPATAHAIVVRNVSIGHYRISLQAGLILALAGGVLALAGGVVGALSARRGRKEPDEASEPAEAVPLPGDGDGVASDP